jgi:nucleoid-associated protein YgaU
MSSYTVVRGDTLSAIATKVYGNPNLWSKIAAANPGVDSSHLKIGQILKIPAKGEVAPPSSSSASSGTPSHEGVSGSSLVKDPRTEYQVVSGDSLHKIAQKLYGNANRWEEIYNLNKSTIGSSPTKLKIGMILKLPAPPTNTPSSSSPSTSPTR